MKESTPPHSIIDHAEKETDNGLSINYILTEDKLDGRYSYSLRAAWSRGEESATLTDVTSVKDRAELIFKAICGGTVTPFCLAETAEELIESILEDN